VQVDIKWKGNVHFTGTTGSGHTVAMDGPPDSGGENLGSRPMELMLVGLGGCTAFDVVDILRKGRQAVDDVEVAIKAQRADAIPAVFEAIEVHFVIVGTGINSDKVARAIELTAEKYCSASIMLERAGVKISHTFEIKEPQ
jgi:putative redox protein